MVWRTGIEFSVVETKVANEATAATLRAILCSHAHRGTLSRGRIIFRGVNHGVGHRGHGELVVIVLAEDTCTTDADANILGLIKTTSVCHGLCEKVAQTEVYRWWWSSLSCHDYSDDGDDDRDDHNGNDDED